MEIVFWAAIFIGSLFILLKGADIFIKSAEKLGAAAGMSSFVIGVLIVGVGTSLPELASAIAAVIQGTTEIVTANAVGSNIANILLIIGVLATVGGRITVAKDLIDTELPLFTVATVLFLGIALSGTVTFVEALLLFAAYVIYVVYLLRGETETITTEAKNEEVRAGKSRGIRSYAEIAVLLIVGLAGIVLGARYLIESIVTLAGIFGVGAGLISLSAVALGTSLPELFVSLQALRMNKVELAIGNVFGSNAFNILMAVGIPGLFSTLTIDAQTFQIGLPVLAAASFIFLISTISKNIYRWEGLMFLVFYVFFLLKIFGL